MQYQILCTFDLKNATTKNYDDAYKVLEKLGLNRVQAGTPRDVVIPTTTVLGSRSFENTNSHNVAVSYRDVISKEFESLKLSYEIFITAGQNGSWAAK